MHTTRSLSENEWKAPTVDEIVCNIDRIYAAGLFWRAVSPQFLERQSQIMSVIALMAEKLKATLPPDQPLQGRRHRRYSPPLNFLDAPFIRPHRIFTVSPPLRTAHDSLIARHRREARLYVEAIKRAENKQMLNLDLTATNIALVYKQLTTSLEFWEDAKSWCGMPWWRYPRLDFPWAPPSSLPPTPNQAPPGRQLLATSSDSKRLVTFREGEKDSSPEAPAIARVPRCSCSIATGPEFSIALTFRPGVKSISV